MITALEIENALNLTGVTLYGDGTITANEPVTQEMQSLVNGWIQVGKIEFTIKSDLVLQRMTEAERSAMFSARHSAWQVDYFLTRASALGSININDPDLTTAKQLFADLNIIAMDRWPALLAL
jgi:hypothetical protein